MRHPIYRPIPVTSGHHYIGRIQESLSGFRAFDRRDKIVGTYPDAERAANQLRRLGALVST